MQDQALPTIYIITPSYNSEQSIARTINSVIHQTGRFFIRYRVQDGGSTDETVNIVKGFIELLDSPLYIKGCAGISIDVVSKKDSGMYDAITNAVEDLAPSEYDWICWINSDDTLAEGACSVLAEIDAKYNKDWIQWVTGETSIRDSTTGLQISSYQRCHPREVIAQGLCDGIHWDFIQQEGTFFRKRLWDKCDIAEGFCNLKYAGDWNLWRMMSWKADLFKCAWPMGSFHRQEGQLSALKRHMYELEIVKIKSLDSRFNALNSIKEDSLKYYIVDGEYKLLSLAIRERVASDKLTMWKDAALVTNKRANRPHSIHPYNSHDSYHYDHSLPVAIDRPDILYCSEHWQYPAITERYAAEKAIQLLPKSSNCQYIAFPWASLFDYINCNDPKRFVLYNELLRISNLVNKNAAVITVCQHVLARRFKDLFSFIGVTTLYWPHATKADINLRFGAARIRPFPLYPVQAAIYNTYSRSSSEDSVSIPTKKKLFSFRGVCGSGYLTNSRALIAEHLQDLEEGDIEMTGEWHYQKDVYGQQIDSGVKGISDAEASKSRFEEQLFEYIRSLQSAKYVLCPSGSGPNTIRLWECIELSLCPVVISDTYLHPGSSLLWHKAIVAVKETIDDIKNISTVLQEEESSYLSRLHHIEQLKLLYGTTGFINDIIEEWISPSLPINHDDSGIARIVRLLQQADEMYGPNEKRRAISRNLLRLLNN